MIYKHTGLYLVGLLFFTLTTQTVVAAGTIVGSKHDLANYGGGLGNSDEICVFCHTPHNANADLDNDGNIDSEHATRPSAPLWNRRITTMAPYQMYTSATLNMACDNTPSPLSLVCLSCHDIEGPDGADGAVGPTDMHALVNDSNRNNPAIGTQGNCGPRCHTPGGNPPEWWQIGPDLSNEHPISMTYPTAADDPDFFIPPSLQKGWSDVKLFMGRVECPSCHNPHDPTNIPFLRKSMVGSGLCITCHNK